MHLTNVNVWAPFYVIITKEKFHLISERYKRNYMLYDFQNERNFLYLMRMKYDMRTYNIPLPTLVSQSLSLDNENAINILILTYPKTG